MRDQLFALTFLLLLILAAATLTGQVTDQNQLMSRGNHDALVLELPSADARLVENLWKDWLKDNFRVKTSKTRRVKHDELTSPNFRLPGVSAGSKVDLYSLVEEVGKGSQLTVWIATPRGYVSPDLDPGQYVEAEKMLMRFALAVSREQIAGDVEAEENTLKNLEKDLDRLQRDKQRAEESIAEARRRIERLEEDIARNLVEQDLMQQEIAAQLQVVEDTKRKLREYE
jgi:hypothetical protein